MYDTKALAGVPINSVMEKITLIPQCPGTLSGELS